MPGGPILALTAAEFASREELKMFGNTGAQGRAHGAPKQKSVVPVSFPSAGRKMLGVWA